VLGAGPVELLEKQVAQYLAMNLQRRQAHMEAHMEVFEITDCKHAAKRDHIEVGWLLRDQERGVRVRKVRPEFDCSFSHSARVFQQARSLLQEQSRV
jgi:hypothetical protein